MQLFNLLTELPEEVKALVDVDAENQNLYIQHNQTPAYLSLSEELKEQRCYFH